MFLAAVCEKFLAVTLDPDVSKEDALRVIEDRQVFLEGLHRAAAKYHSWIYQEYGYGAELKEVAGYMNEVKDVVRLLDNIWCSAIFGRRVFHDTLTSEGLMFQQEL